MSGKELSTYICHTGHNRRQSILAKVLRGTAVLTCLAALGACSSSPAERQARIATDDRPAQSAPLLDLAQSMADKGRHAAAIPLYRQALGEGDDARGYTGLARSLMAVGQYAEAEEMLFIAAGKAPRSAAVHLGLGEVNLAFGRPQLALESFTKAADLGSRAQAQSGRGIALDALGRHDEALAAHESAIRAGGDDINLRNNLALSHALYDNPEQAVDILEDLIANNDVEPQHRQNLVLAYVLAGETEKAMKMALVDLDNRTALETVSWFGELKALPPSERIAALTAVSIASERAEPRDTAILVMDDSADRAKAGQRLVTPAPEAAPVPEPEPVVEPEPVAEPEPELKDLPPLVDPEGWSVQVAAYRTAAQLIRGQKYYWKTFSDILGPLEPRRSEVDFGDREGTPHGFYYRLNAGPLRDLDQAKQVCADLKAIGAPCWIRPPEPQEGRLPSSERP